MIASRTEGASSPQAGGLCLPFLPGPPPNPLTHTSPARTRPGAEQVVSLPAPLAEEAPHCSPRCVSLKRLCSRWLPGLPSQPPGLVRREKEAGGGDRVELERNPGPQPTGCQPQAEERRETERRAKKPAPGRGQCMKESQSWPWGSPSVMQDFTPALGRRQSRNRPRKSLMEAVGQLCQAWGRRQLSCLSPPAWGDGHQRRYCAHGLSPPPVPPWPLSSSLGRVSVVASVCLSPPSVLSPGGWPLGLYPPHPLPAGLCWGSAMRRPAGTEKAGGGRWGCHGHSYPEPPPPFSPGPHTRFPMSLQAGSGNHFHPGYSLDASAPHIPSLHSAYHPPLGRIPYTRRPRFNHWSKSLSCQAPPSPTFSSSWHLRDQEELPCPEGLVWDGGQRAAFRVRQVQPRAWLCRVAATGTWVSPLNSPSFGLLICKLGKMGAAASLGVKIK